MDQRGLPPSQNHLLATLSQKDFALLRPHLRPISLPLRKTLEEPNTPIKTIYFPEAGLISVVAGTTPNGRIEAGIIGREGMSGIAVLLGSDRSPHSSYLQVAGHGSRMGSDALRDAMRQSASLRDHFLKFALAFANQIIQTALANGRATIEQRLARWILMSTDRLASDELPLTQEFLALMLGVRRAGVTTALQQLTRKGLIKTGRGAIHVHDNAGLTHIANDVYGPAEQEYRRLIGWSPHRAQRVH